MEIEVKDELSSTVERLAAAASLMEQAVERLGHMQTALAGSDEANIERIVATVEAKREAELEDKLAAAERTIAELQARGAAAAVGFGRKTLAVTPGSLFAKPSPGGAVDTMEAGALDAALVSLSLEQRIAVKSQLMRAGLLG